MDDGELTPAAVEVHPAQPVSLTASQPAKAISHHSANSRSCRTEVQNSTSCSIVQTATAGRSPLRRPGAPQRGVHTTGCTPWAEGGRRPRAGFSADQLFAYALA